MIVNFTWPPAIYYQETLIVFMFFLNITNSLWLTKKKIISVVKPKKIQNMELTI